MIITESDIMDRLRRQALTLPPLDLGFRSAPASEAGGIGIDGLLDVAWNDHRFTFAVEAKRLATPRQFADHIATARRIGEAVNLPPLLVVPHFKDEQLSELESLGLSGIDLSGNGTVSVTGAFSVARRGQPNRFPASAKIANVYRGRSSLVARVLTRQPCFSSSLLLRTAIESRGGKISPATVSKALAALEEDLIITRRGNSVRLLQPDRLLDRLAQDTRPPKARGKQTYSFGHAVRPAVNFMQFSGRVVTTGAGAARYHTSLGDEHTQRLYCRSIHEIERAFDSALQPTNTFADIELIETPDLELYFDAVDDGTTYPYASALQCWLELQRGDARQQQAAAPLRERLIRHMSDALQQPTPTPK